MAMTSVSVMMTVFVLNLHYRGPKKNEIPFWIQQLLSLSITNVFRTFSAPKKFKFSCTSKPETNHKRSVSNQNQNQNAKPEIRIPANGLLLSYTDVNETKVKSRLTTDVSDKNHRVLEIYQHVFHANN